MKGKNTSKEAKIKRMQELANIAGTKTIKENKTSTVGTLVNFKKADNGINYGIIKENKNYYIKKGNKKENPDSSDFIYIGGLANKTDYQYKNLSEAEKNLNMVLQSINEANYYKLNNNKNKMLLEEKEEKEVEDIPTEKPVVDDVPSEEPPISDVPSEEPSVDDVPSEEPEIPATPEEKIEKAEDALEKAEEKEDEETVDFPDAEPSPGIDDEFPGLDEPSDEKPSEEIPDEKSGDEEDFDIDKLDLGGDEEGEEGVGDEKPSDEPESEDPIDDIETDETEDGPAEDTDYNLLQSKLGKVTTLLKNMELDEKQVRWTLKYFLEPLSKQQALKNLDVKEREDLANDYIIKLEDVDYDELADKVDADEKQASGLPSEVKEECSECGSFTSFLESRGYTLESVLECGNEEMASNISEYANAYNEGINEGDFENIGAYMSEEIEKKLCEEYGHDDYIKELNECGKKKLYECDDDRISEIKTMWEAYDTNHVDTQPNMVTEEDDKKEDDGEEEEINVDDIDFAPDADIMGADVVKPDGAPTSGTDINVDTQNKTINIAMNEQKLRKYISKRIQMIKEGKPSLNESKNKSINMIDNMICEELKLNEQEQKVRKYVRQRLAEKRGLVKSTINESKKTATMKKLDEMIDREYENHEKETKLRKYVRNRLEEMTGKKKPLLNEGKKSDKLKKLDKLIAEQFELAKKLHEGWGKKK